MSRRWLKILLLLFAADIALMLYWQSRKEHRYDRPIRDAARQSGLPPALIKAVVWRESGFNPKARGKAGEIGLMQLMEFTAQEWADANHVSSFAHEQMFDPGTNTLAGSYYLAKVLKRYSQTDNALTYALADYNAGRANVLKWMKGTAATNSSSFLDQMDFPSTKKYVRTTLERYESYKNEF